VNIVWDTIFADDESPHFGNSNTYAGYGVNADADVGCAVLVRPDQYVAGVWADKDIEKLGRSSSARLDNVCGKPVLIIHSSQVNFWSTSWLKLESTIAAQRNM
jgi:hypothetical protein